MNRAWITGLTVASVAGTGGVAFATMTANTNPASAANTPLAAAETTATVAARAYSFQAGTAGQVNLTADEGALKVDSTVPAAGWLVISYTGPGTHVEVQLGDGLQIVTFAADLVNGEVLAGISSTPAPTLPTTQAPAAPAPAPAVPPVVLQPGAQPPASSHTSSPSSGGDDEHDDEYDDEDEHEGEHEGEDGDD
jgi:hypothetical protein